MKNFLMQSQTVRNLIPRRVKALYAENTGRFKRVVDRSEHTNVYHCCVHKTGSQWIRKILSDPDTYAYSGLRPYHYQSRLKHGDKRDVKDRSFSEPFPEKRIVSPIYINFDRFRELPKPADYRAFFVSRDPRDVLVSWYFSTAYSHPGKRRDVHREKLLELDVPKGMAYGFELLSERGLFDAIESWRNAAEQDPNVIVIRYEDLVGERARAEFCRLFEHLEFPFPDAVLARLLERYSFERMSGRRRGQEQKKSKFRKGVAGDWKNYFDDDLKQRFVSSTRAV
jgi:hypothetical protein